MAFIIRVYLKNSSFSEEYAQEKYQGEDSPENIRYEWEDEFKLAGNSVVLERNSTYLLAGERGESDAFSYDIKDVMTFVFVGDEGSTPVVFSEKAVDEYILDTTNKTVTVYLNDVEVIENPIPGIYIALSDFPKELRG